MKNQKTYSPEQAAVRLSLLCVPNEFVKISYAPSIHRWTLQIADEQYCGNSFGEAVANAWEGEKIGTMEGGKP